MSDDAEKPVKISTPEELAIIESEKAKPSSAPGYWAKTSCKHCYGRGIIGTCTSTLKGNNVVKQELLCQCAQKRFVQWRNDFTTKWLKEYRTPKPDAESTASIDNS